MKRGFLNDPKPGQELLDRVCPRYKGKRAEIAAVLSDLLGQAEGHLLMAPVRGRSRKEQERAIVAYRRACEQFTRAISSVRELHRHARIGLELLEGQLLKGLGEPITIHGRGRPRSWKRDGERKLLDLGVSRTDARALLAAIEVKAKVASKRW